MPQIRKPSALPAKGEIFVSFDVDGTLEFGEPRGPIPPTVVRELQSLGYVVGSASSRGAADQAALWDRAGIVPSFVVSKEHLSTVVHLNSGLLVLLHIGDSSSDRVAAEQAGASFMHVYSLTDLQWKDSTLAIEKVTVAIETARRGGT